MALSEAQKQEWLSEDNLRIVLMDLQFHDGVSLDTLRVASYPYVMPIGDTTIDPIDGVSLLTDLIYDDIISGVPNIVTRLDSDETVGGIDLLNTDGEYDWLLNDVTVVGHKIILYIGDNKWSRDNFLPILEGVVSGITSTGPSNIQLQLRDKKESLNVPLQGQVYIKELTQSEWDALSPAEKAATDEYWHKLMDEVDASHTGGNFQGYIANSSNGGYDRSLAVIPDATKDTHVPICLGKCFNIEPVLVDSFNHIYHVHDSDEGIEQVLEVRSNGVPLLGPEPRSMLLTDATADFKKGDNITDNTDIRIGGHVYNTTGSAPNQRIFYYPVDSTYPFSATTGTFTANIDSEPEIHPDPYLLTESTYILSAEWSWEPSKLILTNSSGFSLANIKYTEFESIHGTEYVVKFTVSNFTQTGTGGFLRIYIGYVGDFFDVTAAGSYQIVLNTDNTGMPAEFSPVRFVTWGGTGTLDAEINFWSIRELNTSAAQATAVTPANAGIRIHRLDVDTYTRGGQDGFVIGETIVDDGTPPATPPSGVVVGTTGDKNNNDYKIFYIPDDYLNDFYNGSGSFTGSTSGCIATAVDPIVLSTGSTGQYEVDLDLGIIRLLDHSQGTQITCDVVGQNGRSDIVPADAAPVLEHSAAHLLEWILLEKAGVPFDDLCQQTFPYTGTKGFDNLSPLGVYYKEEITITDVTNFIANSVGGYLRFKDAVCKLQLYKFIDPVGETPDLYMGDDDVIENGITLNAIEEPKYALTLGYRKNWKTQDEGSLAGSITDASSPYYNLEVLNAYKNDYSSIYKRLTAITLDEYPLAEDAPIIETAIFNSLDAQDEIDRRAVLREQRRRILRVESLATSFTYDIGDIVNITHTRFGLSAGKNALIIGMEESPTSNRVILDLWL